MIERKPSPVLSGDAERVLMIYADNHSSTEIVRSSYLTRRRTVQVCHGLFAICRSEMRARWSDVVLAVDPSLSGYAVFGKGVSDEWRVHDLGKWDERWRFKFENRARPRDVVSLSELDPLCDVQTVIETRELPQLEIAEDLDFQTSQSILHGMASVNFGVHLLF